MTDTLERTVLPPVEDESIGELLDLLKKIGTEPLAATTISGPNGESLILPAELYEVLRDVAEAMARGEAVTIAPVHQRLTTQEAADLLGISRPTFVKILEAGEIDYQQPGRHRRVLLSDVLDYQEKRSERRREALDRIMEISEEAGMYEKTAQPIKTR